MRWKSNFPIGQIRKCQRVNCFNSFMVMRKGQAYCGAECAQEAALQQRRECWQRNKAKYRPSAARTAAELADRFIELAER